MPVCGNCGLPHPRAADVRACYDRSSEQGAAESRGRRQVKADGATVSTAAFLRATMTESETALWHRLRQTFAGQRFAAQVVMIGYSVDFYCHRLALAIEVDGRSHRGRERADQLREDDLRANHVEVVRVPAELVMADIERALDIIRAAIDVRTRQLERPPRQPVEPAPYRPAITATTPCCASGAGLSTGRSPRGGASRTARTSPRRDVPHRPAPAGTAVNRAW